MNSNPRHSSDAIRRSGRSWRTYTWAHRLTAAAFVALLVAGRSSAFPWLKGSLTATRLFDWVPFVDPLAAVEVAVASRAIRSDLIVGASLLLILGAILGRVFCGWICPLGLILDLNDDLRRWARARRAFGRLRLPTFKLPGEIKYGILALTLVLSAISSLPIFTAFSPVNMVALAAVFSPGWELAAVGGIALFEHIAPRAFCRALCPLGALYAIVGRWAWWKVRIRTDDEKGLLCIRCSDHCPMGIRVMEAHVTKNKSAVNDPECSRCGSCVDVCPAKALTLDAVGRRGGN